MDTLLLAMHLNDSLDTSVIQPDKLMKLLSLLQNQLIEDAPTMTSMKVKNYVEMKV